MDADTKKGNPEENTPSKDQAPDDGVKHWKEGLCFEGKLEGESGEESRVLPVSGLMFCCSVVGAGLLREWAWIGVPEMGCWAAADWSCAIRGSCQVVVLSTWLWTYNKFQHVCICNLMDKKCKTHFNLGPALPVLPVAFDRRELSTCSHEYNWLKPHSLQN